MDEQKRVAADTEIDRITGQQVGNNVFVERRRVPHQYRSPPNGIGSTGMDDVMARGRARTDAYENGKGDVFAKNNLHQRLIGESVRPTIGMSPSPLPFLPDVLACLELRIKSLREADQRLVDMRSRIFGDGGNRSAPSSGQVEAMGTIMHQIHRAIAEIETLTGTMQDHISALEALG